ncbi:DNA replication and repair protein RecN [Fontimonas thermophila]|uniref:DNA repair protein RecN n=1 Tax=Fontimonas thermophila TaxID=1076937 RepID=A0A1I2ISP7_9GAMM|nr:DNA repair protein RecN [Fontimonas thermophila]SFF44653.1 DNA replication and repair protein RecN [Fontimonas thermophila]
MLKALTIHNLAVIDTLDLEWGPGFSVLTGETGAGKSILIDAIGLAIGTRADTGLIRNGAERAEVSAEFEIDPGSPAAAWLRDNALTDTDQPTTLLIRRIIAHGGRGRAFINGTPVATTQLRELGEHLIEIFGQAESQTLLRADIQRELLDAYGGHTAALDAVAQAAATVAQTARDIDDLRHAAGRDPAQLEFLRFQLHELDALKLGEGELEQIEADHRRLSSAGRLLADGGQAQERLYGGDNSLYDQLSAIQGLLENLQTLHPAFGPVIETLASAQAQIQDAADTIRQILDRLDLDPQRLAEVEARLQAIHDLARKHRIRADALPAHHAALRAQLDTLEHASERLSELQRAHAAALRQYRQATEMLSTARRQAAQRFGEEVTAVVRTLGMPHALLSVAIDTDPQGPARAHGNDEVRFDFTANPGQPARSLAKVASGGELSRISLAIAVVGLRRRGAPTMIFDEIDAGISGAVAEIVGQRLRALGAERQVLCVTHLAQVAAQGHRHYGIRKRVRNGQTFTQVEPLTEPQRIEELARMQGGAELSDAALEHARDLLQRAGTV